MAKAKKLPSGSWRCRAYAGTDATGKKQYVSFTAETKKKAEYAAAEFVMHQHATENGNLTVNEAIDQYIAGKPHLSPNTIRGYRTIQKSMMQDIINKKLRMLTSSTVQSSVNNDSATHSPKTLRNAYGLLQAVISSYAPELNIRVEYPQKKPAKIVIPTDEEVKKLIDAARGTKMEIPILLAAHLGLRRGEIGALTYDDVDFEHKTIRISKAIAITENRQTVIKGPKSVSGNRILLLPDHILDAIQKKRNSGEPLIELTVIAITHAFIKIVNKLEMPYLHFHSLRHYNASVMLALGVPDKYAMERMGHATNTMLKTVYQHTMTAKRNEIAANVNNYMAAILEKDDTKDDTVSKKAPE